MTHTLAHTITRRQTLRYVQSFAEKVKVLQSLRMDPSVEIISNQTWLLRNDLDFFNVAC